MDRTEHTVEELERTCADYLRAIKKREAERAEAIRERVYAIDLATLAAAERDEAVDLLRRHLIRPKTGPWRTDIDASIADFLARLDAAAKADQ